MSDPLAKYVKDSPTWVSTESPTPTSGNTDRPPGWRLFDARCAEYEIQQKLEEIWGENSVLGIGWDDYDSSLEVYAREAQIDTLPTIDIAVIKALGFERYWINYPDGTEQYNGGQRKETPGRNTWQHFNNSGWAKREIRAPTSGNDRTQALIAEVDRMLAEMGDADPVGKMSLEAQRQKLMATSGNEEVEAMCLALSGGFENRHGMSPYVLAGVNFIRKQAAQVEHLVRLNKSTLETAAAQIAELQKNAELGKIVRRLFDRTGSAVTVEVAETIQAELFRELSAALANRSADSETVARPETE